MRRQFTASEWEEAVKQDPGLLGVSPLDAAKRLSLSEQEIGELMLQGYLNVSDIIDNDGEVTSIVIPERDVQRYAITRQAQRDRFPERK